MNKLKPGLNDISNSDYHADKSYLSSTSLKKLLKDPEVFYKEHFLGEGENKSSNAFDEGSYAHTLILEPHMVKEEYAFFEGWRKYGKDWDAFLTKHGDSGKILLSKPQRVRVEKLIDVYDQMEVAKELISGGFPEQTVAGTLSDVPIKVRADYINVDRGYIADVKTTGRAGDLDSFKYTISDYSYQLSGALYSMMFEKFYGKPFDFYFIVLSKKEVTCDVYKMSSDTMAEGKAMVIEGLSLYKKCLKTGLWTSRKKCANMALNDKYEIEEV